MYQSSVCFPDNGETDDSAETDGPSDADRAGDELEIKRTDEHLLTPK